MLNTASTFSSVARVLGIIPARYASTRFPGKPLIDIGGKTMIQRVYERALQSYLTEVVVATDDQRIADEVDRFNGKYVLTSEMHQSGTDRCAEVMKILPGYEIAINIQGDEPFIDPAQINRLIACFELPGTQLATLVKEIHEYADLFNPNIPKVVLNNVKKAIYFSRQALPYLRNYPAEQWLTQHTYYKHIGIYGYTVKALENIASLPPSSLEIAESLEQLRWIESGFEIQTALTTIETIAIDTPEDLVKIKGYL